MIDRSLAQDLLMRIMASWEKQDAWSIGAAYSESASWVSPEDIVQGRRAIILKLVRSFSALRGKRLELEIISFESNPTGTMAFAKVSWRLVARDVKGPHESGTSWITFRMEGDELLIVHDASWGD